MKHRDIQLLKKIISECKDIIRYVNEIGEKGFLENDVYQKATKRIAILSSLYITSSQ